MTTLYVVPAALDEADDANLWWRANRLSAPDLFEDELRAAFRDLLEHPQLGRPYPTPPYPDTRRSEMPRTRYAVYYRFDEARDHIDVVAIWSTRRGRGPF